jgi:uncharacterized protein YjbI with pentapeptide repeats
MAATREQLEARWETDEGIQLARTMSPLLDRGLTTMDELRKMVNQLPFIEEVAPQLDLRALHLPVEDILVNEFIVIKHMDLSGVRFDYLRDIGNIVKCQMHGTIFDEMSNINGIFGSDFSHASFVKATLQGVRFWYGQVSGANFQQARLGLADFTEIACDGASFVDADLRFSKWGDSDVRGTDFRGANLTGAGLQGILFDEDTRLEGANLRNASMDEDFRAFVQRGGAIVNTAGNRARDYDLACMDALIAVMQEKEYNEDGHLDPVLPYVLVQREKLAHSEERPSYPWSDELYPELVEVFSEDIADEVFDIVLPEGMRLLAYYL